jgi:alpha-beta hydrolase superfamily lysophospholipase
MRSAGILIGVLVLLLPGSAHAATCTNADALKVPGAEMQTVACLEDLTTAGTSKDGHTDQSDYEGLHAAGTVNPSGVPGVQVDGYFPDTSVSNATHGWAHDSQFVMRFPDEWNGKLVITGAPGVRKQYAADFIIGDFVLDRGYAYASTDKGNTGQSFQNDGVDPGDAVAEWHRRVTELTLAAKAVAQQKYGRAPARTYMTGISNGGYLTRWQIENQPELYDGAVDWEGTLMTAAGPNLFTYLPAALRHYPDYRRGDEAAHQAMIDAGFEPGSEFIWDHHYGYYWDLTQRIYREEYDPGYDGSLNGGVPFCRPGTPSCDADYDYASRPPEVKAAVAKTELTGKIGKPMLTLHGTLDALLPIRTDSDVYARMIQAAGRGELHRYYTVEAGSHVDGNHDVFKSEMRPILPCYRQAFIAMEAWVEKDAAPPDTQFVPRPAEGDVINECTLKPGSAKPGAGNPPTASAPGGKVAPRGLTASVAPPRDRKAPFRFTVSGRLILATGADARKACGPGGRVSAQVRRGKRPVVVRLARLRSDCTYRVALRFARQPARKLALRVRFAGNAETAPASAAVRYLRLG